VEIEMPEFFLDELTTFKPGIQDTVLAKLDRLQEEAYPSTQSATETPSTKHKNGQKSGTG